jgi:hypothetical protein
MVMTLIKCSIRRYYGAESVEFGAELEIDLQDAHSKKAAYTRLYQSMDEVHKHYAAELLPKAPNTNPKKDAATAGDFEYFECGRLIVETKDNKKDYKIKGGKFNAHGVRIWDEVLTRHGFTDIPIEGLDMTGWTAKVLRENGKPKNIVALQSHE